MQAGYLVKVTLISVVPETESQTPFLPCQESQCSALLAYLNMISFPLSRKVLATESVSNWGFHVPKVVPTYFIGICFQTILLSSWGGITVPTPTNVKT